MKLKEKIAIVTGAASGIGKAIALALSNEGAKVAVADIDGDGALKVVREINSSGGEAIAIRTDVTRFDEVKSMVTEVGNKLGEIDILVNNAGGADTRSFVWEKPLETWNAAIALSLNSVFYCCREVLPQMIKRKSGRIINISSCGGIVGIPGMSAYSASKAGIFGFTKALAKEVALHGITVNSVSPGPIGTEALLAYLEKVDEKRKEGYLTASGLGRLGKPEEVAHMVVSLAVDEAAFITGQDHVVGGLRNLGH